MILSVYKESNMTSRDICNIISKHFKTKKVGHTGTLDPLASGLLIVCTNKDTKLVDILTAKKKEYIATIKLGIKTDTLDITGNIIEKKDYNFTKEELINVLNSFLGKSKQEVPLYSAVKINGRKLYEYARNNINIELPVRDIEIYNIELLEYEKDLITFKVEVSKGTYIRSLINDICTKLNTVGVMSYLLRTKQGDFLVDNSNKLDDILNDNYKVITYEEVFKNYPTINLNEEEYYKVINGVKMNFNIKDDIIALKYSNKYIALYKYSDGLYKMYKYLLTN